jgi:hypothetical protein
MNKYLLSLPNVVGYGTGYKNTNGKLTNQISTVVLVTEKLEPLMLNKQEMIPSEINSFPTDVVAVGNIRALRTGIHRPAPGGVSIGHYQITAGTLGTVVQDGKSNALLILSNNHVIANSNAGKRGDAIYQPGPHDGGTSAQTIAYLERWVPISFGGSRSCSFVNPVPNTVDAALALPIRERDVSRDIIGIGPVFGTMPAFLGQEVRKSGRTTGLTQGSVTVIKAVVNVSYGSSGSAVFEGQIITTNMSQGGDSGSLLVDGEENKAVGLLFAGSDSVTIHNPIKDVVDKLDIII